MGMNGFKNWLGNKLMDLSFQIFPKNQATSIGGVEYNPYIFQDSIEVLLDLRQRIDFLEQKSEQLHSLDQVKKQINLLRQDTDQSILETYTILQQIGQLLTRYSDDLRQAEQTAGKEKHSANSLKTCLDKVAFIRKQLRRYQSNLLRNHRNLSELTTFMPPQLVAPTTENCSY